jgi:lipopolysaccharide export system protein LptA
LLIDLVSPQTSLTCAALCLAGLTAAAATLALPDDNRQPITIRTQEAIRDETKGTTVYRGDVEIVKGSLVINADEVTLTQADRSARPARDSRDPLAGSNVVLIEASGTPARMQQLHRASPAYARQPGHPSPQPPGATEFLIPPPLVSAIFTLYRV